MLGDHEMLIYTNKQKLSAACIYPTKNESDAEEKHVLGGVQFYLPNLPDAQIHPSLRNIW